MARRRAVLAGLVSAAALVGPALAEDGRQILTIDQERLLFDSLPGRALLAQQEAAADALTAEGSALDRAFEAEERSLTERRASLAPGAFRALADAFDAKVVATRREQEQKSTELARRLEAERRDFFRTVRPILVELLRETGASAVLDQRAVLLSNQDLNITDEVIKRLNDAHRAGQITPLPPRSSDE